MTTIVANNLSGIYTPATAIPQNTLEVSANPSGYTTVSPNDLFSGTPPSLPLNRIANIFNGTTTITNASFGADNNIYPSTSITNTTIPQTIVRTHDFSQGTKRVRWAYTHSNPANPDWSLLDDFVAKNLALGNEIMHTLVTTPTVLSARPAEAGNYGVGTAAEPSNLADWDSYCTAVATRYLGKIKYYEIWNEVNLAGFYTGSQTILAQMVRRANIAIKAVDPTAKIVSPSVTSLNTAPALTYFLNMMNASDGAAGTMKNWIDVVGIHLYPANVYSINTIPAMISGIRAHMATLGLSGLPLWNTEISLLSPDFATLSSDLRTKAIQQVLTLCFANASGGCNKSFWYASDSLGSLGFTQADVDAYTSFTILLKNGVTVINTLPGNRMAAVVGGQQFIW